MAIRIDLNKLTTKRPFNPDEVSPWSEIGRVILDTNGNEIGNLNKDNSNKWEDDSLVNWVEVENKGWNVMVKIPKFYYGKLPFNVNGSYDNGHIWLISDKPEEGLELQPAFMRCRDKLCDDITGVAIEVNYRYAPAFLGWKDGSGKLRSLPNKSPTVNITIGNSRLSARANGNGWGILDFNLYFAIQLLYAVEYGNYDSQTALGRGYVDGNSSAINTGNTLQYGNHSYGEATGKKQMSYRGIEDLWGNCRYWIDGFFNNISRHMLVGNKGFNNVGNGYVDKGQGSTSNISGYLGNIQSNKDCGFVMSVGGGGSANTKLYDYGRLFDGSLPDAGGCWFDASNVGFASIDCSCSTASVYPYFSLSLCF